MRLSLSGATKVLVRSGRSHLWPSCVCLSGSCKRAAKREAAAAACQPRSLPCARAPPRTRQGQVGALHSVNVVVFLLLLLFSLHSGRPANLHRMRGILANEHHWHQAASSSSVECVHCGKCLAQKRAREKAAQKLFAARGLEAKFLNENQLLVAAHQHRQLTRPKSAAGQPENQLLRVRWWPPAGGCNFVLLQWRASLRLRALSRLQLPLAVK